MLPYTGKGTGNVKNFRALQGIEKIKRGKIEK
jgi:hypothetical protein